MQFGISTAFSEPSHLAALARAAENAGFARVAVSDHVVHPREIRTRYPYTADGRPRWPPFTDWLDPFVAIATMAAVTRRIRFFTSVYVLPMRNPFLVAKTVASAAVLSGGRIELGVGAGWMEEEFERMEQPFATRGRRMDEMIDVLRLLWSGGFVEHHGEHYDFDALEMSPAPERPVPIYVGGTSPPALRRAATRGDGWISDLHTTSELATLIEDLGRRRREAGRDREPFETLITCSDAFDLDGYRRLADLGATHLTTMPWLFYGGDPAALSTRLDGIARFGDEVIAHL